MTLPILIKIKLQAGKTLLYCNCITEQREDCCLHRRPGGAETQPCPCNGQAHLVISTPLGWSWGGRQRQGQRNHSAKGGQAAHKGSASGQHQVRRHWTTCLGVGDALPQQLQPSQVWATWDTCFFLHWPPTSRLVTVQLCGALVQENKVNGS